MPAPAVVVELRFSGDPARLALRPQHRERLAAAHADGEVVSAGPFADESGALLIFSAGRERVEELLAEDPYYAAPGVEIVSIREWTPVTGG